MLEFYTDAYDGPKQFRLLCEEGLRVGEGREWYRKMTLDFSNTFSVIVFVFFFRVLKYFLCHRFCPLYNTVLKTQISSLSRQNETEIVILCKKVTTISQKNEYCFQVNYFVENKIRQGGKGIPVAEILKGMGT